MTAKNIRYALMIGTMVLFLVILLSCSRGEKYPNIIYILSDDLGYNDLGCYGQKDIKTPNIDKLAKSGILFTQHYSGSPVCAPSRASLLTGKHTGHNTIRGNEDFLLDKDEVTIAKVLKSAGYETACIGKWGIGHPPPVDNPKTNGFDYFFGALSMWHAHDYYPEFLWRNGQKVKLNNVSKHLDKHYKEGQRELTGYAIERNEYTSDLYTQDALSWIENRKGPYFLYLAYTTPHANNEARDLGAEHGMEVPDYGIYADKNWPNAEKGKAAMITRLDSDIGRIIKELKTIGEYENTLIIFTSDNGPHAEGGVDPEYFDSNGKLRGIKRDLYEGGIRIPMIASWPLKTKGGTSSDLISSFWDVLPTFAELVDQPVPNNIDGISFLPTLMGDYKNQVKHEFLYWEFHEGSSKQAVRIGNWKAIRNSPTEPIEVYDLLKNISEEYNIAEKHPEIVEQAKQLFQSERNNEEVWPLKNNQ